MRLGVTSLLFTSGILTNAFGVVTGILLARLLGPDGRGDVAIYLFWAVILAGVLGFSLHTTATFHIARLSGDARKRAEDTVLRLIFRIAVLMGPVGYLILLVIDTQRYFSTIGLITFIYIIAEIMRPAILGIDAGKRDYGKLAFYRLVTPVLNMAMLGMFALTGTLGVAEAVFSVTAASIITVAIRVIGRRVLSATKRLYSRRVLKSSLLLHPPQLLELMKNNLDRAVIAVLLPVEQMGLYVVAYTFASAPYAVIQQAFTSQLLTDFSSDKTAAGRWKKIKNSLMISAATATVLFAALYFVLPYMTPALVGAGYEVVPAISIFLALAFVFRMMVVTLIVYLKSTRSSKWLMLIEGIYIVGFFGSVLAFEPSDALGVARCVLVGFVATFGLSVVLIWRIAACSENTVLRESGVRIKGD